MSWKKDFQQNGIATIENFLPENECQKYLDEMKKILKQLQEEKKIVKTGFVTDFSDHNPSKGDPYVEKLWKSSETIDYFFEPNVFDGETGQLKEGLEFENAICKVGHALHMKNQVFYDLIWSEKCKNLFKDLEWENPRVPQSMYIFKSPKYGSPAPPHRDGSFLYNPKIDIDEKGERDFTAGENIIGLWLALEDADLENSCLWAVPGSHLQTESRQDTLPRRSYRKNGVMVDEGTDEDHPESAWKPLPVKKGTLVLIHGAVLHKSKPNLSDRSRQIVTWHCIEGGKGCKWSEGNWQQLEDKSGLFQAYY